MQGGAAAAAAQSQQGRQGQHKARQPKRKVCDCIGVKGNMKVCEKHRRQAHTWDRTWLMEGATTSRSPPPPCTGAQGAWGRFPGEGVPAGPPPP